MAADDVASALAMMATSAPVNDMIEIAGPEQFRLPGIIRQQLSARNDPREVIVDPEARYYGIAVGERALVAEDSARLGKTRFDDWLRATQVSAKMGEQGKQAVKESKQAA